MPHHTQKFFLEFPIPIQHGSRYSRTCMRSKDEHIKRRKKLVLKMVATQHNTPPKMRVDGDKTCQQSSGKSHIYKL